MFRDIQIKTNDYENLLLFDTHKITVSRDEANNVELLIHPCNIGKVTIRYAKEPYACKIYLANGKTKDIHLGDECDWGNIQQMNPGDKFKGYKKGEYPKDWDKRIGWGNDVDGHIEIVKVELLDGFPNGTEIPLKEFWQDVGDFIIYYEG